MVEDRLASTPGRVMISGASGLLGSAVTKRLEDAGHPVTRLVRRPSRTASEVEWDPTQGRLDPEALSGSDAIIHLSGESIAGARWSAAKKTRILQSRVSSTRTLARAIAQSPQPPKVVLSASAVGYYGDRGDERLDEQSSAGTGFLSEVCQAWEDEIRPVEAAGIRLVRMRIGMVVSARGGAIKVMLPAFRLGLGGPVGGGQQWLSWIDLEDLVEAMCFAIDTPTLSGPVNFVAPEPVRNVELANTLGRALHRPAFIPLPKFMVEAGLGEMGDQLLLASQRVEPKALLDAGFRFSYPTLEASLYHQLDSRAEGS